MSEIVLSSSSDNIDKAIDEYTDRSSFSGSSDSNSSSSGSSSEGNTLDEYTSGVPGVPLEVLQEGLKTRFESGSKAGTSAPSSTVQDKEEEEVVYSCGIGIDSKTDDRKIELLKTWYQIPNELNPRLAVRGEWCCQPRFGIGIYEAYLLGGLRLPLNNFARELLTMLGLGVCQFNPNAWRLVVREVFEGNRPLTVDKFLYCYKPSEINQSLGFYQFTTRGKDYRLIKSLVTSDRNWKMEFFFISGFWAGHPIEVDKDPFPPYIGELGNLRPEGMFVPTLLFNFLFFLFVI